MLENLKNIEVPPPPADMDTRVHLQVNRLLFVSHLIELGVKVMPEALVHLVQAAASSLAFSLTGQYDFTKDKGENHE